MSDDLVAISELLTPNNTPLEVLQIFVNNNNFVSNVAVALQIILTMYWSHQVNEVFPN